MFPPFLRHQTAAAVNGGADTSSEPARASPGDHPNAGRVLAGGENLWRPRLVSGNLRFVVTNGGDAWAVLGDPSRRQIVTVLAQRPCAVAELAGQLPISRPAVSQHLKVLKDAGLVTDESRGTRRVYSVDAERLARFRAELDGFWSGALDNLRGLLDDAEEDG